MAKIAITGNIGSGKTAALNFFKKKKYLTISSDELIKELYANKESREKILKSLGVEKDNYKEEIINKMHDPSFNYKLKKTLYPLMHILRRKQSCRNISNRNTFFEIPLLFEEKMGNYYDTVLFVEADYNKRLSRVLNKGLTKKYFDLMNHYQFSNRLKQVNSDITILNNGSLADLYQTLSRCEWIL